MDRQSWRQHKHSIISTAFPYDCCVRLLPLGCMSRRSCLPSFSNSPFSHLNYCTDVYDLYSHWYSSISIVVR